MITVFDSSNYAQQIFLKEAYATLAAQGRILNQDEINAGKFLNLDGYFAHMADLVSIRPDYVLIPSDEEPFEINANTREIKVPSTTFGKCAGVVGDDMSEIITFVIDRYFDYTDLAQANICIQWKLPGVDGEEGVSHIGLRDLITSSGKIRFGWPLTKELTKTAGNITFSVRFYKEKVINEDDENKETKIVYLFNTKTATIPIVAGLSVNGENAIVEQGISNLFKDFVQNSENPSYPMPKPVSYVMDKEHDLPEIAKINENDTLVLRAQATTSGDGYINYNWYLKEGVNDRTDAEAISTLITGDEIQFEVNHNDYVSAGTEWNKIATNKQYYIANNDALPGGYERVTYKLVNGKNAFFKMDNSAVEEETELFERYTTLTIVPVPEGSTDINYTKITGLYHVGARNVVGEEEIVVTNEVTDINNQKVIIQYTVPGVNSTPELMSSECNLRTPADINITTDLIDTFIKDGVTLKLSVEKDIGNPNRTYSWYRYINNIEKDGNGQWKATEEAEPITVKVDGPLSLDTNILSDLEPGWYYVHINSSLNRAFKEENSTLVRVVNHPEKPVISSMEYSVWTDKETPPQEDAEWTYIYKKNATDNDPINTNGINAYYGDVITLRINLEELHPELDPLLVSDDIKYEWFYSREDGEYVPVTASLILSNDINDLHIHESTKLNHNTLVVRSSADVKDQAFSYYCKITNTLANEAISLTEKDYEDKEVFLVY